MLMRKQLFSVAINLVQNESMDRNRVAEIQRKYGDYLYSKQDYDGAMSQYIHTIGFLEPSYVVRLFLDAHRIRNLTNYLELLHDSGHANADHTTLLLNCYIKLQDIPKLDAFLLGSKPDAMPKGKPGSQGSVDEYRARFDVATVIKVCRSAGYFQHAEQVAKRAHEQDLRLSILMEDLERYDEAIQLLRTTGETPAHSF